MQDPAIGASATNTYLVGTHLFHSNKLKVTCVQLLPAAGFAISADAVAIAIIIARRDLRPLHLHQQRQITWAKLPLTAPLCLQWQPATARFNHALWCRRSEEHTSELQSRPHLVCRLLLEKKNI